VVLDLGDDLVGGPLGVELFIDDGLSQAAMKDGNRKKGCK